MTANLDCKRKPEMADLLQETKDKLEQNAERLIDAEADLHEIQETNNVANIAVKKKVVDILETNKIVLNDRKVKLEALLAQC